MKTEGETTVKTYFPKNKALAEKGDDESQFKLGKIYGRGWLGVTKDYKQAIYWLEKAAQQGHVEAQSYLGRLYFCTVGFKEDCEQAFYWFEKAAVQGDSDAQFNLGYMYFNGKGVKRDYEQAIYWTKKAMAQGHADAQHNLDAMYRKMPLTAQLAMALKGAFYNT